MVEVTFPFSILNNIPAVSGVDDVVIDIPDLDEIRDEVEDALDEALDDVLTESDTADVIGQLEDRPGQWGLVLAEGLENALFVGGQPTELLEDIASAIEADSGGGDGGGLDVDIEALIDEAVNTLLDAIDEAAVNTDEIIEAIEEEFQPDFDDLAISADSIAEAVAREVQITEEGGISIQIDGFFGPVGRDIVEGFAGVLQKLLDEDGVGIPDQSDITNIFDDRLSSFFEDLPGGDILTDPDSFIEDLVDALTDALVSEEASEQLQNALDNR
jgi:predicted transcriptional regulator